MRASAPANCRRGLTQADMRADAFLLAVGPDETLRGAASLFRGSLSFFVAPSQGLAP